MEIKSVDGFVSSNESVLYSVIMVCQFRILLLSWTLMVHLGCSLLN